MFLRFLRNVRICNAVRRCSAKKKDLPTLQGSLISTKDTVRVLVFGITTGRKVAGIGVALEDLAGLVLRFLRRVRI